MYGLPKNIPNYFGKWFENFSTFKYVRNLLKWIADKLLDVKRLLKSICLNIEDE